MPRNGSGSYSLPEAAFVPNTPISSGAVNNDFSDIASALTGSLARDGQGGMTAVLPLANLGFAYLNDPNTGMRRTAADAQAIFNGGVDVIETTTTSVNISVAFTVGGAPLLPIGLGPLQWSGTTAPPKWVLANGQSLLRASYPDLWAFAQAEIALGNTLYTNGNGTTTFTVTDMSGRAGAGREAVATRLTAPFFGGNSTILGATGGLQSNTLTAAQIPSITSAGSNVINVGVSGTQTVLVANSVDIFDHGAFGGTGQRSPGNTASMSNTSNNPIFTGTNTINVTSNNTSGGAHNNVQPTIIVNYIIYAGA